MPLIVGHSLRKSEELQQARVFNLLWLLHLLTLSESCALHCLLPTSLAFCAFNSRTDFMVQHLHVHMLLHCFSRTNYHALCSYEPVLAKPANKKGCPHLAFLT